MWSISAQGHRAQSGATLTSRWSELIRPPETIARVVFSFAVVEACAGLPLTVGRLIALIFSRGSSRIAEPELLVRILLFRIFIIVGGLTAVFITSAVYQDLRALLRSGRSSGSSPGSGSRERRWRLTELQEGSLRRGGKQVVFMGACLTMLHVADVCLTAAAGLARGPVGQVVAWSSICLLTLHVLLVVIAVLVYRWHWKRHGPSGGSWKVCRPYVNLNMCSRIVGEVPAEVCSICLCCPSGAEVVSTLPCGHTFHRTCLEPWLRQGHCCPLRCSAARAAAEAAPMPPPQSNGGLAQHIADELEELQVISTSV